MNPQPQNLTAYPLAWPADWGRAKIHCPSRYRVDFPQARADLIRQLNLMQACDIIISSNLPVRNDGLPYAKVSAPFDPGVAVYWHDPSGQLRVIACDKWSAPAENLRAIGVTLSCLRGIERAGASEAVQKALSGFRALPQGTAAQAGSSWRDVLGFRPGDPVDMETLKFRFRALSRVHHPDHGGSTKKMQELLEAHDAGKAALEQFAAQA